MNKIDKDYCRFIKGDSSLIELFNILSIMDEKPSFQGDLDNQRKKTLSIKGSDISYRVLNHWCNKGLIEDNRKTGIEDKSWRRFSIFDRLWIEVIIELRHYGVSLEIIKKIKEKMAMPVVEKNNNLTNFEYAVYRCRLISDSQTHLVVFKDGFSEIASELDMETASMMGDWNSYIYINLNKIWSKFSDDFSSNKAKSFILTDGEFKLLAALRLEKNSEISVQLHKDGSINRLKKTKILKPHEVEDYMANEMKFGEVIQKFEDGTCCAMKVVSNEKVK